MVDVMHGSSSWILGEEEGLLRDLTIHSSGQWSDRCGRVARSGSGDDMSSDEGEFLRKRNPKEGRELMWW
jgi:hypothetical protein